MSKATKAEVKEALAERDFWIALGKPMGWELYGWTFRRGASYITPIPNDPKRTHTLHISRDQMEDIARAIKAGAKP